MGAPAARASELARCWARDGHDVTVLTGFPNHPTGVIPREYRSKMAQLLWREKRDAVDVVRTWLLPFPNRKAYERILNYSSFCISSATGFNAVTIHDSAAGGPRISTRCIRRSARHRAISQVHCSGRGSSDVVCRRASHSRLAYAVRRSAPSLVDRTSLTILWVLAITNAFNLIDGLDGLAAGSALFSTLVVFVVALFSQSGLVSVMALRAGGSDPGFSAIQLQPCDYFPRRRRQSVYWISIERPRSAGRAKSSNHHRRRHSGRFVWVTDPGNGSLDPAPFHQWPASLHRGSRAHSP